MSISTNPANLPVHDSSRTRDQRPRCRLAVFEREWAVAGRPVAARRVSVSFNDDGTQIVLVSVMPDDKGMKIQVRTWDGTPRRLGAS
jgi:hypothetical protein